MAMRLKVLTTNLAVKKPTSSGTVDETWKVIDNPEAIWNKIENYLQISQRWQQIYGDLDGASLKVNVFLTDDAGVNSKFFLPTEVSSKYSISGMDGCLIVVRANQGKEVMLVKGKSPSGWDVTRKSGSGKAYAYREAGYQSPMLTCLHEFGHAWQWVKWKTPFERLVADAYQYGGTGISPATLKIELNNLLNNEIFAALQLQEGLRWTYDSLYQWDDDTVLSAKDLAGEKKRIVEKKRKWPMYQYKDFATFVLSHPKLPIALAYS